MATCFVIQPFDTGGKYDKRFRDIYKPAIEAADLEAYRVDQDPSVAVPIESVDKQIRLSSVCLADITTDNPNVWYELGFAFAAGRPVVMVCSKERPGKYPFDIQHRSIIAYEADSPSDFEALKTSLTAKLKAMAEQGETLSQIADAGSLATVQGLSQVELMVLAVLASETYAIAIHFVRRHAERACLTGVGFNLALRRMIDKGLVEKTDIANEDGEIYDGVQVSDEGWRWIGDNEDHFVLRKPADEIPF
jgi:hypothetical protein